MPSAWRSTRSTTSVEVSTPCRQVLWAGNLSTALGVAAVHLLPSWSVFSDSFGGGGKGITAMSWSVVAVEIAGALAMGINGAFALRNQRIHQA